MSKKHDSDNDFNLLPGGWRVQEAHRQKQAANAETLWLIFWGLLAFTAVAAIVVMFL